MKQQLPLAVLYFALASVANAKEPKFYKEFDWHLKPGDQRISGEELTEMIVGMTQLINYRNGMKTEELYKKNGTFQYSSDGVLAISAPSYKIHPSGLACIAHGEPPDYPYCTLYVTNGDRLIAVKHYKGDVYQVDVKFKE
jgi:hypothetical protein